MSERKVHRGHNDHVVDGVNLDVEEAETIEEAARRFLRYTENLPPSRLPEPVVTVHEGVRVVREDMISGSKVRCAEALLTSPEGQGYKRVAYVQTRVGLAGISLLDAAKRTGHEVHLFMPACKKLSYHQACCIERGAIPHFMRVVAMPNLNRAAAKWCRENETLMVPPGLRHPIATAALVRTAAAIRQPEIVYVATSTGVLVRALQLAWPDAEFGSVCVARNMKAGELGKAHPISEPLPFTSKEKPANMPPFPSIATYDAKVWKYVPKNTGRDVLMWNVGAEPVLNDPSICERIDGWRTWEEGLR